MHLAFDLEGSAVDSSLDAFLRELGLAVAGGRYMISVWRTDGGRVHMWRSTRNFPVQDFEVAISLLRTDVAAESVRATRLIIPGSSIPPIHD